MHQTKSSGWINEIGHFGVQMLEIVAAEDGEGRHFCIMRKKLSGFIRSLTQDVFWRKQKRTAMQQAAAPYHCSVIAFPAPTHTCKQVTVTVVMETGSQVSTRADWKTFQTLFFGTVRLSF